MKENPDTYRAGLSAPTVHREISHQPHVEHVFVVLFDRDSKIIIFIFINDDKEHNLLLRSVEVHPQNRCSRSPIHFTFTTEKHCGVTWHPELRLLYPMTDQRSRLDVSARPPALQAE